MKKALLFLIPMLLMGTVFAFHINVGIDLTPPMVKSHEMETTPVVPNMTNCIDSDGKDNFNTTGVVTAEYDNGAVRVFQDKCAFIDGKWVAVDFYCGDEGPNYTVKECPCFAGRCLNKPLLGVEGKILNVTEKVQNVSNKVQMRVEAEIQKRKVNITITEENGTYTKIIETPAVKIITTKEVDVENGTLRINKVVINPDRIVNITKIINVNITELQVEEEGNKTVLVGHAVEKRKLFGFIPVRMRTTVKIDPITDSIIEHKKPWWAFLAV